MNFSVFTRWLNRKWQPAQTQAEFNQLTEAFGLCFATEHGRIVLNDLLDNIYCTVCDSDDPYKVVAHNAQRKTIQYILLELDKAYHPEKYIPKNEQEEHYDPRVVND